MLFEAPGFKRVTMFVSKKWRSLLSLGSSLIVFMHLQSCESSKKTPVQVIAPPPAHSVTPTPSEDRSVARLWNETILNAIRNDFARPTVHARNLFHSSAAMYDVWGAYVNTTSPYLLGRRFATTDCSLDTSVFYGNTSVSDEDWLRGEREEAISYAAYRLIQHRFKSSPGVDFIMLESDNLMVSLGYDVALTSMDVSTGAASALGNFIAACYIGFGLEDGANEIGEYRNQYYAPVNPPLSPQLAGNPGILDLNRWQPLALDIFVDQAGIPIIGGALQFLSPEWGNVQPFALTDNELSLHERDGNQYKVYYDPGAPPMLGAEQSAAYQWGFNLVAQWSSHLDPSDGVMWDISPANVGNVMTLPAEVSDYPDFYNALEGGDTSQGRELNPSTGLPYKEQWVPRGDYTRVLAEFWADGPDSETPPGHWFVILNSVTDHPDLKRKFRGQGQPVDLLEWDIKSYFTLGGAMHDAAITSWGIKGWYDYTRPVSAIRAMADLGQSSEPEGMSWHPNGIPLSSGHVEIVQAGDKLAGYEDQFVGKVKVRAWQGPDYIVKETTDTADVGWILAEDWWPYQRPSFVTPPFAGYISGHSTYSRAAAEVLTLLTGDEYFPGGKSVFAIEANNFLVFEQGPSVDMTLEWATYRDASDQCSLSRIWGGIHPPADDIPGRIIGESIGKKAFSLAEKYFHGEKE